MTTSPFDNGPRDETTGVEMTQLDAATMLLLNQMRCVVAMPTEGDLKGKVCIVYEFRVIGPDGSKIRIPTIVAPVDEGQIEFMRDQFLSTVTRAREALGFLDRADAPIYCPGPCGRRIFGDVAVRGACLECFPRLPDDDDTELGVEP